MRDVFKCCVAILLGNSPRWKNAKLCYTNVSDFGNTRCIIAIFLDGTNVYYQIWHRKL